MKHIIFCIIRRLEPVLTLSTNCNKKKKNKANSDSELLADPLNEEYVAVSGNRTRVPLVTSRVC